MEVTAKNIDRLVTTEMRWGSRSDRGIIAPLYECACEKLGGKSPRLVAAQRLIEEVSAGDNVFIMTEFATFPNMPCGETDGPLGVASLARAVKFGLSALPIIIAGGRDMKPVCQDKKVSRLNELLSKGVISQALFDRATEIRLWAGIVKHKSLSGGVDEEDAKQLLTYLEVILNEVYVEQRRLEEIKKKRENKGEKQ